MALALYRKYRPDHFAELVGQSAVQDTLLEALKQNRLVHAYLFSGPRGTGKTSTARLIARCIQCETPGENGESCGKCSVCEMSLSGKLVDLVEIDAASNRGIDEIRELREKMQFAPNYAKSKVYIIDEVHMLTKEAFNALLKSLEEPPPHVYFILATTEIHKIPETILSRCQRYDFKRIGTEAIVNRLKWISKQENFDVEDAALELIAEHASGGMRDAISLLEQFSSEKLTLALVQERLGLNHHGAVDSLLTALQNQDTQAALQVIEKLHDQGVHLQEFCNAILSCLRHALHRAVAEKNRAEVQKLLEWTEHFDAAWLKLKRASIAQLPLEIAVIRSTQVAFTPSESSAPETMTKRITTEKPASPAPEKAPEAKTENTAPQPAEQSAPPISQEKRKEGLMHMDAFTQNMSKILAAIKTPMLRKSFQTGNIKRYEKGEVEFVFSSQFHFDHVHSAQGIVEIEAAMQSVMGSDVKLHCSLEKTELAPETNTSVSLEWETVEEPINS